MTRQEISRCHGWVGEVVVHGAMTDEARRSINPLIQNCRDFARSLMTTACDQGVDADVLCAYERLARSFDALDSAVNGGSAL